MLLFIDTVSLNSNITLINNDSIINSVKIPTNNNYKISDIIINKLILTFKKKQNINNIKFIAVCIGPGSFTSLRIGVSVAIGLKYSLGLPLYGFKSFDILLKYARKKYLIENIYVLIQSFNDQNFLVAYNKYNKMIFKPYKIKEKLNKISTKDNNNSILITNNDLDKKKFTNFKKIIITDIYKTLNDNMIKELCKRKKIIRPIY